MCVFGFVCYIYVNFDVICTHSRKQCQNIYYPRLGSLYLHASGSMVVIVEFCEEVSACTSSFLDNIRL